MRDLDLKTLTEACRPGGASVLCSETELSPAVGESAGVAPARYVKGNESTYAFEDRFLGGEKVRTVLLDGKAAQLNRGELLLSQEIGDEHPVLVRVPRVVLRYRGMRPLTDMDLPHRVFDGHIRAGSINGNPVTQDERYIALRNVTPANARALLETAPAALVFGAWDSTRKVNQVRIRSALVGEIIGVLADQSGSERIPRRGGARVDPIAPSVQLSAADALQILSAQENELSSKLVEKIKADAQKNKKSDGRLSGSSLGLGSIPPSLDSLGLISCRRIIRHHVLSFAALRQLRFGAGVEGDAACRALLAALALNSLVRSNSELCIRANCDLVEAEEPRFWLDARNGNRIDLQRPEIEAADQLLSEAMDQAEALADVKWAGQTFDVVGNEAILGAANADEEE